MRRNSTTLIIAVTTHPRIGNPDFTHNENRRHSCTDAHSCTATFVYDKMTKIGKKTEKMMKISKKMKKNDEKGKKMKKRKK